MERAVKRALLWLLRGLLLLTLVGWCWVRWRVVLPRAAALSPAFPGIRDLGVSRAAASGSDGTGRSGAGVGQCGVLLYDARGGPVGASAALRGKPHVFFPHGSGRCKQ